MRNLLYIFLLFLPAFTFGQVVKTAALTYTKGSGYTPNIASSSELRVDTAASALYWWDRDALTWIRFRPGVDVITGSVAPSYTPRDNQSLFAVNADGELYYYNSPSWVQIGGAGGGGIYGGSGNVPDGTVATLVDDFEFTGPDISSFTVSTGTTNGGQLFSNLSGATVIHRDTANNYLEINNAGANFNFGGTFDRLTITGRDVRYAADYSATFSTRSLIDKGYADAAYLSDADWTTGFSSATQATSSWTATNAGSNVNAAIVPKGTGALLADIPDGTSAGGNARGSRAVDLQTDRNNAAQVASGANSIVLGGRRNTASASYSIAMGGASTASASGAVAIGGNGSTGATASGSGATAIGAASTASATESFAVQSSTASAELSTAFGGTVANHYGEFAHTSFSFLNFYAVTVTGTAETEMFLNSVATDRATLSSGTYWQFEIVVTARVVVVGGGALAAGDCYTASYVGAITNKAGTTALLGTVDALMAAKSDASMADVVFNITADDTNDSLKVTYTAGANSTGSTQTTVSAALKIKVF